MANGAAAVADKNVEFLGLEVGGGKSLQALTVTAKLTGRNEIRIAKNGHVTLKGGTLSSVRWIDVEKGGRFEGYGNVEGDFYCQGVLSIDGLFTVEGEVVLAGELSVSSIGKDMIVLKASSIRGRFKNSEVIVDGKKYKINYNATTISLSK